MRLAGNNGLATYFQPFLSIKNISLTFVACVCIDRCKWSNILWYRHGFESTCLQHLDLFTDTSAAWGKVLSQAGHNKLARGQQYISHVRQKEEICNVKIMGNYDLSLFGLHTNPHQESETFGFLWSRNSVSLSRKNENILSWNFLEGQ